MALYGMGDLHLSLTAEKPMDIFGGVWAGYMDKLRTGLSVLRPEDTLVIIGDVSWGMQLEEAKADLCFIDALPGKKLILKGNHDYWWNTVGKMKRTLSDWGITSIDFIFNNFHLYDDIALCGTRGWFYEETGNDKVFQRELGRLETSLKAAGDREKICFLHYPPLYEGYTCQEMVDLLEQYEVKRCFYGHLHGKSHAMAKQGRIGTVEYRLAAADYLGFCPIKIIP